MRGSGCEAGVRGRCVVLCWPSPLTPSLPASLPLSLAGRPSSARRSLPHIIHPALPAARPTPCTLTPTRCPLAATHDTRITPVMDYVIGHRDLPDNPPSTPSTKPEGVVLGGAHTRPGCGLGGAGRGVTTLVPSG